MVVHYGKSLVLTTFPSLDSERGCHKTNKLTTKGVTEVREDRGVITKALVDCLKPQCPVPFKQSIVDYQTTSF